MQISGRLVRFFPFLAWLSLSPLTLRADLVAGITGALVLVPKAMAYAQLSGLPLYFGLYTAFVPAMIGALWGSSRQLATGPVAIVSLMTAAAVTPLAVSNTPEYIALALLLTVLVGVIQLLLGVVGLGAIVNFISHPVILGFMNAAAIIIALSQLDSLLGIPKGRSDFFLGDIWDMRLHLDQVHVPTVAMALLGLTIMLVLKRMPTVAKGSVLFAVVIATAVSALTGYEQKGHAQLEHIASPAARELVERFQKNETRLSAQMELLTDLATRQREADKNGDTRIVADLKYRMSLLEIDRRALEEEHKEVLRQVRRLRFVRPVDDPEGPLYLNQDVPAGRVMDGRAWHIKDVHGGEMKLVGGGAVVGSVPSGLPAFRLPEVHLDAILQLFPSALIIALVGFMESISMAKAMASKSRQHVDPNQELVGQGLANMAGALFQAYPACGSFTGSAINMQAGAKTGMAMVFNGFFVGLTLLFLTPLLYYLPKAVLAMIIVLAVASLITPRMFVHIWKASRPDGIVALTTFVITLLAAPHLDRGIMVGVALSIGLYLYRTMSPRVAILGRFEDGTLRDVNVRANLTTSPLVTIMRFDGSLYFADVVHFEDAVLKTVSEHRKSRYLLVMGDAINFMDASGEEMLQNLVVQLHDAGVTMVFSGLKKQVLDVMRNTGLADVIGEQNIFANECQALKDIFDRLGDDAQGDALYSYVHVASC